MCGSYEALENGFTVDALIDMSGGIREHFNLKEIRKSLQPYPLAERPAIDYDKFWKLLLSSRKHKCSFSCSIQILPDQQKEQKLSNGLVTGHAYMCTRLAELDIDGQIHRLIRLYNPWGIYVNNLKLFASISLHLIQ